MKAIENDAEDSTAAVSQPLQATSPSPINIAE